MKKMGKIVLALAVFVILGQAVTASAYGLYGYPYCAPAAVFYPRVTVVPVTTVAAYVAPVTYAYPVVVPAPIIVPRVTYVAPAYVPVYAPAPCF
ncbi:MAG: hypothetical protein LBG12_06105 [Synergistaceae bacterium]|jgi:hypothetical protein|nr:hypothetical protein [Synergistaceae bacterium]